MPYNMPDFAEIRARMLRDVRNMDADAHVGADSDHYIRASAVASAAEGLYDYLGWMTRQIIPDTADTEYLELHAALRGITRKPATTSTGVLTVTGVTGSVVPAGTQARDADGGLYRTTAAVALNETGRASAPCEAAVSGALPDLADAPIVLVNAPSGVHGSARLTLTGGTDAEDDASLLARLLEYMRDPPGGGAAADYRRWAKETPGVTDASVYPLRQGPGTVDIVITGEEGIPSSDVIAACQSHMDAMRPATAMANVYAPVPLTVDMTWRVRTDGTRTLAELQGPISTVLAARFALLRPGDPVVLAKLLAAVAGLAGVADASVTLPVANVSVAAMGWARLGAVTLEGM